MMRGMDKTLAAIRQAADEVGLGLVMDLMDRAQEILDAAPEHFEAFWTLYPRKVGKPAALNAFKRLNCDKHFEAIKASILERLVSKEWERTAARVHFIPHPTTFLNQARWLDAPMPREKTRWEQV
jgi:hypothetical protein